jgi:hypothetical protein
MPERTETVSIRRCNVCGTNSSVQRSFNLYAVQEGEDRINPCACMAPAQPWMCQGCGGEGKVEGSCSYRRCISCGGRVLRN